MGIRLAQEKSLEGPGIVASLSRKDGSWYWDADGTPGDGSSAASFVLSWIR